MCGSYNLEFVSANPTGPLHVGHCRGAIFGDVLSNLLKFDGNKVIKEYYINDYGNQINNFIARVIFILFFTFSSFCLKIILIILQHSNYFSSPDLPETFWDLPWPSYIPRNQFEKKYFRPTIIIVQYWSSRFGHFS